MSRPGASPSEEEKLLRGRKDSREHLDPVTSSPGPAPRRPKGALAARVLATCAPILLVSAVLVSSASASAQGRRRRDRRNRRMGFVQGSALEASAVMLAELRQPPGHHHSQASSVRVPQRREQASPFPTKLLPTKVQHPSCSCPYIPSPY